jgi:cell division protein FtsZ
VEEEEPHFAGFDPRAAAPAEDSLHVEETDDGLPAPAYRPEVAEVAPQPEPQAAETFVAPKAPRPGQPSAETLARLQAAIHRAPSRQAEAPQEEKSRFGINSLINRMTGERQQGAAPQATAAPQQPSRQQPSLRPQEAARHAEPAKDPEQERIEIPAFLRRQAN